jgi:hypothetical protein
MQRYIVSFMRLCQEAQLATMGHSPWWLLTFKYHQRKRNLSLIDLQMKFIFALIPLMVAIPVNTPTTPTTPNVASEAPKTSPAPITNVLVQPITNNVQNDNKAMAISGNAANRDQTNTAVTQENNAKHQTVVGSQSDSHDVNVINSNSITLNNSNTTVTNTDKSVYNTSNVSVANDFSNKAQNTVNNHYQEVQNVYKIEQRMAAAQGPASQPNTNQQNTGYAMNPSGGAPAANLASNQVVINNNNRISMEMIRDMVKNAKATSDMAYELVLQLTQ